MRIELLLVAESFEVGFDGERDNGRRAISQILLQSFGIHVEQVQN